MSETLTIDGVGPMPVERPQSVAELCAIVRRCADSNTAIYPVGGGTMLDYGMPPARPGIALSTTALNQVIDYPARDLTITVQAGITLKVLQETLAAENQWLPIDIPAQATIGGAIACDVSGPRRYGYGTLRDYIIGISVVNDRGEECKAGGRVVKNVAGYDMMKLHTGALGTLGVITQVTLKVKPRPETDRFVFVLCSKDGPASALRTLSTSKTRPTSAYVVRSTLGWEMGVWFDGSASTVHSQDQQFRSEISEKSTQLVLNHSPHDIPSFPGEPVGATFQVFLPPSRLSDQLKQIEQIDPALSVYAWPSVAMIGVSLHCPDQWPVSRVQDLIGWLAKTSDRIMVSRCPHDWKKSLPIWGHPPDDLALQKAVKRALDPRNIFNPGRFVTDAF